MKHNALGLVFLIGLVTSGISLADDKSAAIKVAEDVLIYRATLDGKPVAWFGVDGKMYQYVIDMNMKLPKAAELKTSLLATLAQDKEHRDKIVFSPFTPSDKTPELVKIVIGKEVPLKVVQNILGELSRFPEMKLALSVSEVEDQSLGTRRVYIGSLGKSGKEASTQEMVKSLLDPKLTHAEFLKKIKKDKDK